MHLDSLYLLFELWMHHGDTLADALHVFIIIRHDIKAIVVFLGDGCHILQILLGEPFSINVLTVGFQRIR